MSGVLVPFNRMSEGCSGIRAIRTQDAPGIDVDHLSLHLETGETLMQDVSFKLRPGDRLILMGKSGSGKSSLLWAIYGLWKFKGEGTVRLPDEGTLYVSQVPYFPLLNLRGILAYPRDAQAFTDADMRDVLTAIGMPELIPELDADIDGKIWKNRLSGGQQQKIVFGRVLLNKPRVLLVDEISSALDEETETMLYKRLIDQLPQTILISVSHRPHIVSLHTLLGIVADKRLKIEPVTKGPQSRIDAERPDTNSRFLRIIRALV